VQSDATTQNNFFTIHFFGIDPAVPPDHFSRTEALSANWTQRRAERGRDAAARNVRNSPSLGQNGRRVFEERKEMR
jgi:hypothetical protein